jgi:hypothetical protein
MSAVPERLAIAPTEMSLVLIDPIQSGWWILSVTKKAIIGHRKMKLSVAKSQIGGYKKNICRLMQR